MTFYPPNTGRGPFPPRYRQNFGPPPFGRQGGPMPGGPFRRQTPYFQQQNQMGNPYYSQGPFGNQGQSFFNQNQFGQQGPAAYYPNQQFGARGLTGNLSNLMGHVDTVKNGVNMLRQFGSLMTLFRS